MDNFNKTYKSDKVISKFTVLFENPFWIGIYEHEDEDKARYEVCKITFGAEPKDYEVYEFIMKNFCKLKFSPSIETKQIVEKHINPKRMQREIKKQIKDIGICTKAQQVLKLQQEQEKLQRKAHFRNKKENEKERQFILRQEKHKGH